MTALLDVKQLSIRYATDKGDVQAVDKLDFTLQANEIPRIRKLRNYFYEAMCEHIPGLILNGHPEERLPNTLNVSFPGVSGAQLLVELGDVCASTGSACHEGSGEVSPVLRAMGVPEEVAYGAVRFSLGRWTTREELDQVIERLGRWAHQGARANTLWQRFKSIFSR